jgi:hypothetical protein
VPGRLLCLSVQKGLQCQPLVEGPKELLALLRHSYSRPTTHLQQILQADHRLAGVRLGRVFHLATDCCKESRHHPAALQLRIQGLPPHVLAGLQGSTVLEQPGPGEHHQQLKEEIESPSQRVPLHIYGLQLRGGLRDRTEVKSRADSVVGQVDHAEAAEELAGTGVEGKGGQVRDEVAGEVEVLLGVEPDGGKPSELAISGGEFARAPLALSRRVL